MIAKFALLIAAGSLMASVPVQAANISFNLDESLQFAAPGGNLTFTGTVTNFGAGTAFLNGTSFGFDFPLDDMQFFLNFPASLPPGADASGTVFTVSVPSAASLGLHVGSFSLLGGDTALAADVLSTVNFGILLVPEPATVSMLVVGLLFVAMGMVRPATPAGDRSKKAG